MKMDQMNEYFEERGFEVARTYIKVEGVYRFAIKKWGHILEDDTLARLISMPNVIVTSHQAFLTEEALSNIAETTVQNIVDIFERGECPNELCYRGGDAADCKSGKCF
mgnify:CR=1 FL=1